MHQMGVMQLVKKLHEKFEISKEIQADKLVITFKGKKEAVEMLNKKIDAMHVLMEGCSCCEGDDHHAGHGGDCC